MSLANGKLAGTTAAIYTVPSNRVGNVKSIWLVNTHSAAVTVNLYVRSGSNLRHITPVDLTLGIGYRAVEDTPILLGPGEKIEGDASVADKVEFVICGTEAWNE